MLQSLNGVYIDNVRLPKDTGHVLKDGEKVQIGVALKPGQPPPYVWVYRDKLKVKKIKMTTTGKEEDNKTEFHVSSQKSVCDDGKSTDNLEVKTDRSARKRSRSPDPCIPSTSGKHN